MHWIYLTLAILFEVAGTTCMKLSLGFTKLPASISMAIFYAACVIFLTLALKKIDVSVAYAVWSGVGVALIGSIGVVYFREPLTGLKIFSLLAIIVGVVALNLERVTR